MKLQALVVAAFGVLLLSACKGEQQQQQGLANTPLEYKPVKVKAENRTIETKYSATIRGRQDIQVLPQVSGTLQRLCVT